ncbi:MAG: hypothetical protein HY245_06040 [Rhizobiales bacterium]|nr:hypothetical protein [Hyphomicrobiales bacterium]MBI3672966.1 hypothetical protein [Hyphomicrobiales bacterium]
MLLTVKEYLKTASALQHMARRMGNLSLKRKLNLQSQKLKALARMAAKQQSSQEPKANPKP